MWARSRIDIGWADLAFAARRCLLPGDRDALAREVESLWSTGGDALVCASVADGFDLLLGAWDLPAGSEVLFSAINTPAMFEVARRRGLVAVPIDLDAESLAPDPRAFDRAVTPAARAVVVASLFGMRPDLGPILDVARRLHLRVVEDAATAFAGRGWSGDDRADATLVSTGRSSLGTALGGALLRVRDPEACAAMRRRDGDRPQESASATFARVLAAAASKVRETRLVCTAARYLGRIASRSGDAPRPAATAARAERRCSAPLLALLRRRLVRWKPAGLAARRSAARTLLDALGESVGTPGIGSALHGFREFAIVVDDPARMVASLRAAGFDAGPVSGLAALEPPSDRSHLQPAVAGDLLERFVILPCGPAMPRTELLRLAAAVRWAASSGTD